MSCPALAPMRVMVKPKAKSRDQNQERPRSPIFQTHIRRSTMLENIGKLAEAVATDVSRRAFLERFGRGALACAAAVAGLLALPPLAQARPIARCCQNWGVCQKPGPHCILVNNCAFSTPAGFHSCLWNCKGTDTYSDCVR